MTAWWMPTWIRLQKQGQNAGDCPDAPGGGGITQASGTAPGRRRDRPEERSFLKLKPLGWTGAERGDAARYEGSEIVQFARHCGPYKAGQRVVAAEFRRKREA